MKGTNDDDYLGKRLLNIRPDPDPGDEAPTSRPTSSDIEDNDKVNNEKEDQKFLMDRCQ